jgi:hypothetical protein
MDVSVRDFADVDRLRPLLPTSKVLALYRESRDYKDGEQEESSAKQAVIIRVLWILP